MSERSFFKILLATTACLTLSLISNVVEAQVRQSSNYQIQSDSVNFGGGYSSSTNYQQESTVGEVATGESNSASYVLKAGYQQMQEVYLALTGGSDVVMAAIPGIGGATSNGSTTLTAITDSPSGYQLTIQAENDPAMQNGVYSIDDYVPDAAAPDLHFTIADNETQFAYSPFGSHVAQRFQTNGSACNVSGSASSTACWDGLTTSPVTIAQSTSANHPSGTDTSIYFKVGLGVSSVQVAGDYVATSTVTLLAL